MGVEILDTATRNALPIAVDGPRFGRFAGWGNSMSDTDSFIEEVNEEVRRDRLYSLMRRYGWIPIVIILGLVGGTAWNEYRKAQDEAAAQALGDAVLAAAQIQDPPERLEALRAVEAGDSGAAVTLSLLEAATLGEAGDLRGMISVLEPLTLDQELSPVYRDLAALRMVTQGGDSVPSNIRADLLDRLSAPGAPFRLLGLEQRALFELEQGETETAIATLQGLMQESDVTDALIQRSAQLLAALGADAPSAVGQ